MEISLETIFAVLRKCVILMVIMALVAGIGAFFASDYLITPTYSSVAKINVVTSKEASSISEANSGTSFITKILKTCTQLLESNTFNQKVKEDASLDFRPNLVFEMSEDSTIILIKAYDSDPQRACDIAQSAADNSVNYINEMTSGVATVKIYDAAQVPLTPTSPNSTKNAIVAAIAVAVLIFFIYFLVELLGTKVKGEKELASKFDNIPIIATIPDFYDSAKHSKRYYYYNKYGSYGSYGSYGEYASHEAEYNTDKTVKNVNGEEKQNG